ncbi:hypothetical protein K491DRAFT_101808 [Lophiostoma macrostomum CBS 122681]|uniref:Uncharacterized protein n=1 Tax=Lophiostoma macrostomum CBS 122681 TaxID=1314788 RepID=A0A6A6SX76_9PLEO|nr:hypothetical protein K491DRAFT_101808 [Lophiostoma macrostomum CBS 122681]
MVPQADTETGRGHGASRSLLVPVPRSCREEDRNGSFIACQRSKRQGNKPTPNVACDCESRNVNGDRHDFSIFEVCCARPVRQCHNISLEGHGASLEFEFEAPRSRRGQKSFARGRSHNEARYERNMIDIAGDDKSLCMALFKQRGCCSRQHELSGMWRGLTYYYDTPERRR